MLAITLIAAACFIVIQAGTPFAPPLAFAGARLLIAGGVLLGLLALLREPLLPPRWTWPWLAGLALAASGIAYGPMFLSQELTGAGLASVVGNTQPLMVAGLAALLLGERMTPAKWTALVLGMGGVSLIAYPAMATPGAYDLAGAGLALTSAGGLAAGSVMIKLMGVRIPLLTVTTWQLLLGSLPLLAASAFLEPQRAVTWSVTFVVALLFLAVAGTAFLTFAWYRLIQQDDVGRLSMFFFLVPVFGLGLAMLALGERIGPVEGAGVGLIVAGIAVIGREAWRGSSGTPARSA